MGRLSPCEANGVKGVKGVEVVEGVEVNFAP